MATGRRSLSQQDARDRLHRSPCSLSFSCGAWSVTSGSACNACTGWARAPDLRDRRAYRTTTIWRTGTDGPLIDELARDGIAHGSFFPLGGLTPLQSSILSEVAARL